MAEDWSFDEPERVDELGHPDPVNLWKNRRRMAWLCVFNLTAMMGWGLITDDIPTNKLELMINLMWPFAAIVGAYIGFSAFTAAVRKK